MSLSGFGALIETNEETNVTTTRIAMATMKAAQISKPGGEFEIVEREILSRARDRCASKYKLAACATATCSQKKANGPEFSFPAYQDMKWPASSMNWVRAFPHGKWENVSASDGMAVRTAHVPRAGAETFATAGI
jgi:hypothetical protein